MFTYELFAYHHGYGFVILFCDNPIITQETKPNVDGFQIMTEEEATTEAIKVLARLEA